jgi:hypothetical protein
MRFGGSSRTWGGGVALIDDAPDDVPSRVRLYLVTLEQFADVVAQENWLDPGSVDLSGVTFAPHHVIGPDHVYRVVLQVGELDGTPVLTITQDPSAPVAAPTMRYLRHIAQGLREAHGMSDEEIAAYLVTRPGVTDTYDTAELLSGLASA